MTNYRTDEECERSRSKPSLSQPTYRLAGFGTLLTIVLVAASCFMSMKNSSNEPAERARMVLREATILGPLVQHNVPTGTVLLKNSGQSPALKTQIRLVMTVWPSKQFPNWNMPLELNADAKHLGTIAPGSVVSQTVSLITPLTDVHGMYLERKDWFILILGVMSYTDSFGGIHVTNMCLIWRDVSSERMSLCEKWNEGY